MFTINSLSVTPATPQEQTRVSSAPWLPNTSFLNSSMMSFSPSTPTPLTSKQAKRISFDSSASPLFSPSAAARYAQQNEQWNQVSIPFLQIALFLQPHHLIIY